MNRVRPRRPAYANHLRDLIPTLEQLDANFLPARGGNDEDEVD